MTSLPPFPVDSHTLDLLYAAANPSPGVERSSVNDLCLLFSEMAGSNTDAVEDVDGDVQVMRDPQYHVNDVVTALIDEVRRLRRVGP